MRRIVLAFIFSLVSLSRIAAGQAVPAGSLPPRASLAFAPYAIVSPYGVPVVRAELGRLAVSENRAGGSSRRIELAVVRLPSISRRPGFPIVWLAGGPGWSGIADLETPMLSFLLELRRLGDVLVLDQRGMGLSTPRLDCPGTIDFPRDVPLDRSHALGGLVTAARDCAAHWRARGVDLSAYNTRESAEDIEDLRRALGAAKLRLIAGSYGTHLALAVIRAHEERIERAVLVGVVGPDHLRRIPSDVQGQLEKVSRLVRLDTALSAPMPDLLAAVRDVRERLDARPVAVSFPARDGGSVSVAVGKFDFDWYVRWLLSSRETIAHVPAVCAAMAAGDFRELATAALSWRSGPAPPAAVFTMRCAAGVSVEREERVRAEREVALLGEASDLAEESVCRAWGVDPLPAEFRSPVISALPTLFVSGTLDGVTPEGNATEVIRGFRNGARLSVDGAAHAGLGFGAPESRAALLRFLEGSRAGVERVALPAPVFERPDRDSRPGLLASTRPLVPAHFGGGPP